jgi:hypothetical protein
MIQNLFTPFSLVIKNMIKILSPFRLNFLLSSYRKQNTLLENILEIASNITTAVGCLLISTKVFVISNMYSAPIVTVYLTKFASIFYQCGGVKATGGNYKIFSIILPTCYSHLTYLKINILLGLCSIEGKGFYDIGRFSNSRIFYFYCFVQNSMVLTKR